jgi:hypothetical protein
MESSKSTLHTLPQDIILNIADHFLDDYLIWKTQFPYLRKLTFKGDTCPYLNLARTHSTLWNMLLARRFAQKALREVRLLKAISSPFATEFFGIISHIQEFVYSHYPETGLIKGYAC